MRVFFSTGEASGDMLAAALGTALREFEPDVRLCGIGADRMLAAGFVVTTRTRGWASLGPLAALQRIAPLLVTMLRHAIWLRAVPHDLIVLVDFGAFNLRFAKTLRALGYRRPILYFVPPGAWLDRTRQAREVGRHTVPLIPFAHQWDFYRSLGIAAAYFGHPLVSLIEPRGPRETAPSDGGIVALLPGSRRGEIERHLPRLLAAAQRLHARRPQARFILSVASDDAAGYIAAVLRKHPMPIVAQMVRGADGALAEADAAWIASGTAVLEATLRGVPTVAVYVLERAQAAYGYRVWLRDHRHITLPNILLGREIIPELLQGDATAQRLCDALDALLRDPSGQLRDMCAVRGVLGPSTALRRSAALCAALARSCGAPSVPAGATSAS